MGQQEVYNTLKKLDKASAEEIAEVLLISVDSVRKSLRRLLKYEDVKKIELTRKQVEKEGINFCVRHYVWTIKK